MSSRKRKRSEEVDRLHAPLPSRATSSSHWSRASNLGAYSQSRRGVRRPSPDVPPSASSANVGGYEQEVSWDDAGAPEHSPSADGDDSNDDDEAARQSDADASSNDGAPVAATSLAGDDGPDNVDADEEVAEGTQSAVNTSLGPVAVDFPDSDDDDRDDIDDDDNDAPAVDIPQDLAHALDELQPLLVEDDADSDEEQHSDAEDVAASGHSDASDAANSPDDGEQRDDAAFADKVQDDPWPPPGLSALELANYLADLGDATVSTRLGFYAWTVLHGISVAAFRDLVTLLRRPSFAAEHLPLSLATLARLRDGLPLARIDKHVVPLKTHTTASGRTGKPTALAHHPRLGDVISRSLANASTFPLLHFGLGTKPATTSEAWHGRLWRESVLSSLPDYPLTARNGDFIYPGVVIETAEPTPQLGRIVAIYRDEAGTILCDLERVSRKRPKCLVHALAAGDDLDRRRLWLCLDVHRVVTVELANVAKRLSVLVWRGEGPVALNDLDDGQFLIDYFFVTEPTVEEDEEDEDEDEDGVIAPLAGTGQLDADWRLTLLPAACLRMFAAEKEVADGHVDFEQLARLPRDQRPLGLFVALYHDGFGAFRTSQHSLGAEYLLILNQPQAVSRHLHERLVLGFTPFQASHDASVLPTLRAAVATAQRPLLTSRGKVVVTPAGARGDMLDLNHQVCVKGPGGDCCCRFCLVPHAQLSAASPPLSTYIRRLRQPWTMQRARAEAAACATAKERKATLQAFGLLLEEPALEQAGAAVDVYRTALVDPFHNRGGVLNKTLGILFDGLCSAKGLRLLSATLAAFPLPFGVSLLPPLELYGTYTFGQTLTLGAFLPLVIVVTCQRGVDLFKKWSPADVASKLPKGYERTFEDMLRMLSLAAKGNALAFAPRLREGEVEEMSELLKSLNVAALELISPLSSALDELPNMHQIEHLPETALDLGTSLIASVSLEEAMHRIAKGKVSSTNHRQLHAVLCDHAETLAALRALHDDPDSPSPVVLREAMQRLRVEAPRLFESSVFGAATESQTASPLPRGIRFDSLADLLSERFENIAVGKPLSVRELNRLHLPRTLDPHRDDGDWLNALTSAYDDGYGLSLTPMHLAMSSDVRKLHWWSRLTFFDRILGRNVVIKLGEVAAINVGDADGNPLPVPVRIVGILTHLHLVEDQHRLFLRIEDLLPSSLRHELVPDYPVLVVPKSATPRFIAPSVLSSVRPAHYVPIPTTAALVNRILISHDVFAQEEATRAQEGRAARNRKAASRTERERAASLWWHAPYSVTVA